MRNLEYLITEANKCQTADELINFCRDMVEQYTAGQQEQHNRMIDSVEVKYRFGEGSRSSRERYVFNKLMKFVGNVGLKQKVVKI